MSLPHAGFLNFYSATKILSVFYTNLVLVLMSYSCCLCCFTSFESDTAENTTTFVDILSTLVVLMLFWQYTFATATLRIILRANWS